MSTCVSFRVQVASIMEVLTKTAVAEIIKLVDDGCSALRLEMYRSQRENETLKRNLLRLERELAAVRGYGEPTPGNYLNISFEAQLCDEFREAQRRKGNIPVVECLFDERLITDPAKDDQRIPVEKKKVAPDAFDMKSEPVDTGQDWSESLLPGEDRPEDGAKNSQSQVELNISEENSGGTLGATASNDGEGPHCEEGVLHVQPCPAGDPEKGLQAELKQEPEGQPLTHALPQLGSTEGLGLQSVWRKAKGSGAGWEKLRELSRSSEPGDARIDDKFSPLNFRGSRRLRLEKEKGPSSPLEKQKNGNPCWPLDEISGDMAFPLVSLGERVGSTPCEARFVTLAEAKSHGSVQGQAEFFCTHSGKTLPDTLVRKERHSVGKRFDCSECGKTFAYPVILEKHQQLHKRKKPFTCSWCDKCFSQQHILQAHQSIHVGEKPYICAECGKHFRKKSYLKTHQLVHTRERRFICKLCGKGFSTKSNLNTHQSVHTGERPHSCNECGKSFAHLSHLKSHQRVHTRGKTFSCLQEPAGSSPCEASFATSAETMTPWRTEGQEELIHTHHGKTFPDDLKTPEEQHGVGKLFGCSESGEVFPSSSVLEKHQQVHSRKRPFACSWCDKSFFQWHVLKAHENAHKGVKPYICTECGKLFRQKRYLRIHQLVHTKEKRFICKLCGKGFSTKSNLNTHRRVHTGEKPHSCDECGKSFSHLCNLKSHQRVHTRL